MAIQIQQKRFDRQLKGIENWKKAKDLGLSHSNGWGTLHWETGTGKTFAACTIANKMLEKNNAYSFIVVVPGEELEKQWKNEIKSFVKEEHHNNFRVLTVHKIIQSCANGKRFLCNLLIADELHEYYTEDRLNLFNSTYVVTNWCLGLTATYEDNENRHKNIQKILPVVDRIDTEEALREGYVSKYIEYNVAVPFTDEEKSNYVVLSTIIAKNLGKFGKNKPLELASKVLSGDSKTGKTGKEIAYAYAYYNGWRKDLNINKPEELSIHEQWSPFKIIGYAKTVMDNVRERKDLIYKAINKIHYAKEVVLKFDTLKTICFSQSTQFADYLATVINQHYNSNKEQIDNKVCVVYHSKLNTIIYLDEKGKEKKKGKTVLKREAIQAIKSGKARVISTASSLDRGFDVKDISLAITTSGTQNPTQYSQRRGRAIRVEENKDIVLIVNLYLQGTIEESWLRKRQAKSNNVIYWVNKVQDINYTPKKNDTFNLEEI